MLALFKHCCCGGLISFSVRHHFCIRHTKFTAGWSFPDSYGFEVKYDKEPLFSGLIVTGGYFYLSTKDNYDSIKARGGCFVPETIYSIERVNNEIIGSFYDERMKYIFNHYATGIFYNFTSDISTLYDSLNEKFFRFFADKYLPVFPTIPNYPSLPPHGIYEDPYKKYVFPAFQHLAGFYYDAYYDLKFSIKVNSLNLVESVTYHSFDLVSLSQNLEDY